MHEPGLREAAEQLLNPALHLLLHAADKRFTARVYHLQIIHLVCRRCRHTFGYVTHGRMSATAHGVRWIDAVADLADEATALAARKILRLAARAHGAGRCASCGAVHSHAFRAWFVRLLPILAPFALILLVGTGVAIAQPSAADYHEGIGFHWRVFWRWVAAACAIAVLLPALIAWSIARLRRPIPGSSRTSAELQRFLQECAATGRDPEIRWWHGELGRASPPAADRLLLLGVNDLAGHLLVPPGMSTRERLERLEREFAPRGARRG